MNVSIDNGLGNAAASEAMRHAMVASQLRTNAVNDQRVLVAMNTLPREAFVPAEARAIACRDTALPVAGGRAINLPMVTGRLLTEALASWRRTGRRPGHPGGPRHGGRGGQGWRRPTHRGGDQYMRPH